ncbi:PIN domain-containing protein [Spirochaeta dissipatitropha]
MAKVFFDTNILVYTVDKKDIEKTHKSRELIKNVTQEHAPVISTQVLQEFYNASTSKLGIDKIIVKNLVHNYRNMEIVTIDLLIIEQAIDISILFQLSFWDSLILAAAEQANCTYIISEDLNNGQRIRGIEIVNPFKGDTSLFK